jgi:hypothetical protein
MIADIRHAYLDGVSIHAYTEGPGRLWDPEETLPSIS